jgi:hypothetical protein
MSDFSHATIFKEGPMEVADAVSEILAARSLIEPEDIVIPAHKLSFFNGGGEGVCIESTATQPSELIEFLESGQKSLCALLQFPHHLLRKLGPELQAALFASLYASRFGPSDFVQLRCANRGKRRLRAIFASRQHVFNDRDVFTEISQPSAGFVVDCYWFDDYVSAIRFKSSIPLMLWGGGEVYMGFDVVNSEVRDRSLELRGVLWLGESALIPPKLIFPTFKGKNGHIGDIRGLNRSVRALSDKILGKHFNQHVTTALSALSSAKLSLGWELKNLFKRDVLTTLDILKFLESPKKQSDTRWRDKDAYALCDMEKNTRIPMLSFIQDISAFARGFDTYTKRSSIEFGLNLLF